MKTLKMIFTALMLSLSTMAFAQQQTARSAEQIKEMRWQMVSQKMMLSDAESAKVKPIYDDYLNELRGLHPERNNKPEAKANKQDAKAKASKPERKQSTEAEIKEQMKNKFALQRKQIDIKEKYFDKFCKELNARQAQYLVNSADAMQHPTPRKSFGQNRGQNNRRPGMNGMQRKPF